MPAMLTAYKWRVAATTGPQGRIGHSMCADEYGTKAYVYAGLSATNEVSPTYLDDFWEYDTFTKSWTKIRLTGDVQPSRAFHTAVMYKGKFYIFGGCNSRGRFNKFFCIYPNGHVVALPARNPLPPTRYCHSAVVYSHSMYIYGGKCGGRNSNRRLSDLYQLTFPSSCTLTNTSVYADGMWRVCEQYGEKPEPRSAHSAVVYRNNMLIFGGRNSQGNCCDDIQTYNFRTCHWRQYNVSPTFGRARNSCVLYNGFVILFGGWNGKRKLNDLLWFHIDSETVEKSDQLFPSMRECQAAVVCRQTMVIFGGRMRGELMSETLELDLGPESVVDEILEKLATGWERIPPNLYDGMPQRLQQAYEACMPHNAVSPGVHE